MEVEYELFQSHHWEAVEYLLLSVFVKEEPLSVALGLGFETLEPNRALLAAAQFWRVSHVALEKHSRRLVGCLLSSLVHHNHPPPLIPKHYHLRYRVLMGFEQYASNDLFTLLPDAHVVLKMDALCVHPDARGKGIARALVQLGLQLARQIRCQYAVTLATPVKSQTLFQTKAFTALKHLPYDVYQELDGSFPFASLCPNNPAAKLLYKPIFPPNSSAVSTKQK